MTNDDGVQSPGLHILAAAARRAGMDVLVVAPAFDASGSSAAMTATARSGRVEVEAVPGPECTYGVQGPPAFIVRAAMFGAFGPSPDLVLSGVNRGLNTGRAILHSGTVGAALTAAAYGRRALAVSAGVDDDDSWDPDCAIVAAAIEWLSRAPGSTVLNVNVPAGAGPGRLDPRPTRLAGAGTVQGRMSDIAGRFVPVTFTGSRAPPEPGTDEAALADGFVSVTAISGVNDDTTFDLGGLLKG